MKTLPYDVVYFRILIVTTFVGVVLAAASSSWPTPATQLARNHNPAPPLLSAQSHVSR